MIVKLEGVEYDGEYKKRSTVVRLISADGILAKDLGPYLVESLEEKIAETIDTKGPDNDYGGDY